MPTTTTPARATSAEPPKIGDLLHDIERDVKTIAVGELELARTKLTTFMEQLVLRASVALLGAVVALIGLGMLCMVVVVALAPVLPALWLRLLIMACVYVAIGAGVAALYGKRFASSRGPDFHDQVADLEHTADSVEHEISH